MDVLKSRPLVSKNLFTKIEDSKVLLFDPKRVNWVVVSQPLAEIILTCDGSETIEEIIRKFNVNNDMELYQKLLSSFERLYNFNFLIDTVVNTTEQSKTLDSVYFNLTKNCNLNCIYCYANAGSNTLKSIKEKPLEYWKRTIDQLYDLNNNATINITGGEPTIYRYFWDVVEYAKNRGLKLLLITNGSYSKINDFYKFIDNFITIEVSMDSLREDINSLTRGKGSLFPAKTFIDKIIEIGMKSTIMVVVSKYNKNYLHEIYKKYNHSAIIKFQPMYIMGRGNKLASACITGNEYYCILKSQNIKRMEGDIRYIRNMKNTWCGMGKNVLSIEANGEVYPCQLMHHEKFKLGELDNQALEEIWINSPYRDFSVDMIKECKDCELKYICGAPCRARAFYVLGDIYTKDPLCPDFIKNSIYDNLFEL
jgi:radical SAM protein with 4Fe4S-binding SPASM domain